MSRFDIERSVTSHGQIHMTASRARHRQIVIQYIITQCLLAFSHLKG